MTSTIPLVMKTKYGRNEISIARKLFFNPFSGVYQPRIKDELLDLALGMYLDGIRFSIVRRGDYPFFNAVVRAAICRAYYNDANLLALNHFLEVLDLGEEAVTSPIDEIPLMLRGKWESLPHHIHTVEEKSELFKYTLYALDSYLKKQNISYLAKADRMLFPLQIDRYELK